ncbi:MAG: discoidin domain-containing protein [Salinivirgaceae bacterium]|jgi:hypothetical protein|nr:discoidin domain-containing protein [Salinivirgaceae bacterium]
MQQRIINNKTVKFFCLITFCFLIFSCNKSEYEKKYDQLRKEVLTHYKSDSNPLKEKAAIFLLDNLKKRYAVEGERYKVYSDTIRKYHKKFWVLHKKLMPLKNKSFGEIISADISVLSSEYLIDNIDRAFAAYEKAGWKDQVGFDTFCEYVLPYRIGNEPLENWRKEIENDSLFKITGDTIYSFTDLETAALWFTKKHSIIKKDFWLKWGANAPGVPNLQYSILNLLSTGACSNLAQVSMFACRSICMPIANDFTPHWANATLGHDWVAIITPTGSIPFVLPVKKSMNNYKTPGRIPSKVYRKTFSENKESHAIKKGYCRYLPWIFNNSRLIDVTSLYMPSHDIAIPVIENPDKSKFAYLAVSNRDSWVLVGWGKVKRKMAKYEQVVENSVYLPVFDDGSGIQPLNYPFVIDTIGRPAYLKPDHQNLRKIELFRKHPISWFINKYINSMIGGRFQAANNKDFKNAVTLYTINESPGVYYNDIQLNVPNKYRFVRYLAKDSSQCNVAEIEFYDKNEAKPLIGEFIGAKGYKAFDNVFDGNVLTFFNASEEPNRWVGLDLGKPVEISKIRFVSRNDKNHIISGDSYELFYWENEWKSLGQQVATDKVLVYDQVPSNCLFLLRNYTEGKEERIFTYENGKQVWW